MVGFYKMHRSFEKTSFSKDPVAKSVATHILAIARHTAGDMVWAGYSYTVDKGQCLTSLPALSQATGCTLNQARRALQVLEADQFIIRETTNRYAKITVLNWAKYQTGTGVDKCHATGQNEKKPQARTTGQSRPDGAKQCIKPQARTTGQTKPQANTTGQNDKKPQALITKKECSSERMNTTTAQNAPAGAVEESSLKETASQPLSTPNTQLCGSVPPRDQWGHAPRALGCNFPSDMQARFDKFWAAYPNKHDRIRAQNEWVYQRPEPPIDKILSHIEKRKDSKEWKGGFAWNPENYLIDHRWEEAEELPQERVVERTLSGAELDESGYLANPAASIGKTVVIPDYALAAWHKELSASQVALKGKPLPDFTTRPSHNPKPMLEEKAKAAARMPIVNNLDLVI